MEGIQSFLGRYLNLTPPDTLVRRALAEVLLELFTLRVDPRAIKMVGTVAYLELDTTTKSQLFIHQEKLLSRVEEKLGRKSLTAVR